MEPLKIFQAPTPTGAQIPAWLAAACVAICLAAGPATALAGPATQDTLTVILEKLDQLSASVSGTTPNWDKTLPANDPGGPCPSSSSRFTCIFGGTAVRDNQTGLVWEAAPTAYTFSWDSARFQCANHSTGGQKGWRLPSVHELSSLVDPSRTAPSLPAGHPFIGIAAGYNGYWTASTDVMGPNVAWAMNFYSGYVGLGDKSYASHILCVRGPANPAHY